MVDIVEIIETVDIVKAICYNAGLEFKQPQKCHWITSESLWISRLSTRIPRFICVQKWACDLRDANASKNMIKM